MAKFDVIAFDADDTLWHTERMYVDAQAELARILSTYGAPDLTDERLLATEMRNLAHFGYGTKGFALSMIETAVELTDGRVSGADVQQIIETAKAMLASEIELLPNVRLVLEELAGRYPLMLITKGDLHDQEARIARSGVASVFGGIEIVSDKNASRYDEILRRHGIAAGRFVMVGNSLRSDILPVLEIGGTAVHVPHDLTWAHERAVPPPAGRPGFHQLDHLGLLPALLARLEARGG
jgi:putative hydrolase of the HAD superfamily